MNGEQIKSALGKTPTSFKMHIERILKEMPDPEVMKKKRPRWRQMHRVKRKSDMRE